MRDKWEEDALGGVVSTSRRPVWSSTFPARPKRRALRSLRKCCGPTCGRCRSAKISAVGGGSIGLPRCDVSASRLDHHTICEHSTSESGESCCGILRYLVTIWPLRQPRARTRTTSHPDQHRVRDLQPPCSRRPAVRPDHLGHPSSAVASLDSSGALVEASAESRRSS